MTTHDSIFTCWMCNRSWRAAADDIDGRNGCCPVCAFDENDREDTPWMDGYMDDIRCELEGETDWVDDLSRFDKPDDEGWWCNICGICEEKHDDEYCDRVRGPVSVGAVATIIVAHWVPIVDKDDQVIDIVRSDTLEPTRLVGELREVVETGYCPASTQRVCPGRGTQRQRVAATRTP